MKKHKNMETKDLKTDNIFIKTKHNKKLIKNRKGKFFKN